MCTMRPSHLHRVPTLEPQFSETLRGVPRAAKAGASGSQRWRLFFSRGVHIHLLLPWVWWHSAFRVEILIVARPVFCSAAFCAMVEAVDGTDVDLKQTEAVLVEDGEFAEQPGMVEAIQSDTETPPKKLKTGEHFSEEDSQTLIHEYLGTDSSHASGSKLDQFYQCLHTSVPSRSGTDVCYAAWQSISKGCPSKGNVHVEFLNLFAKDCSAFVLRRS